MDRNRGPDWVGILTGIKLTQVYVSAYDQAVKESPSAIEALNGSYITSAFNFVTPNGPTKAMLDTIAKYDHSFHLGQIPDLGLYSGYIAADLMILGLEHAGTNPTRQAFITNLRKVTNYTAGGLLPTPTSFAHFGTVKGLPKKSCSFLLQVEDGKFVLANGGKAICSTLEKFSS